MPTPSEDKPVHFPAVQPDGSQLKSLTQALLNRRASAHFKPDAFPDKYLEALLRFAAQAPSGYNLQPWRFLVIRDAGNRRRLQAAAYGQEKVSEAPVMVVFFSVKGEWQKHMDDILEEGARRGVGKPENVPETKKRITEFLAHMPEPLWVNRHVMIAFTTMMLLAEVFGLDTAPMEGFDPEAIKREFGLPAAAEIVAMLAIGYARDPDKPYGGRLPLQELVHREKYGSH